MFRRLRTKIAGLHTKIPLTTHWAHTRLTYLQAAADTVENALDNCAVQFFLLDLVVKILDKHSHHLDERHKERAQRHGPKAVGDFPVASVRDYVAPLMMCGAPHHLTRARASLSFALVLC